MPKIRIIHFDTGRTWRGGQNQVLMLVQELISEPDIEQTVVTPEGSGLAEKIAELKIEIINQEPVNDFDLAAAFSLRNTVSRRAPCIVHLHTSKALGTAAAAFWGMRKRIRTVYTKRVGFPIKGGRAALSYKYGPLDCTVAISEYIRKGLLSKGIQNVRKIYSAADAAGENTKRFSSPVISVLMAGEIDLKDKDYITYIRAAGQIYRDEKYRNSFRFRIAGSGPDEKRLLTEIRAEGLDGYIEFLGFVGDMKMLLAGTDLLVHSACLEGLGSIVVEAQAAGIPAVVTDSGGLPETVLDKETGFVVRAGDASAVAARLRDSADARNKFEEMSEKAALRAQELFSKKKMAAEYLSLYRELSCGLKNGDIS